MTLIEKYDPYRKYQGLVTPKGGPSGNGLRYSGEALIMARRRNEEFLAASLKRAMLACEDPMQPGVWNRSQTRTNQQGPDDYHAVALLGKDACARWIDHFWRHFGFFRNRGAGKWYQAFLGRFPQLVAHFYFGAGKMPLLPLRLYWALVLMTGNDKRKEDEWILSWMLIENARWARKKSWLVRKATDKWIDALKRRRKGGIGEVLDRHYNGEYLTPNAEMLIGEFGE